MIGNSEHFLQFKNERDDFESNICWTKFAVDRFLFGSAKISNFTACSVSVVRRMMFGSENLLYHVSIRYQTPPFA